jgi:hypothetical protein
MRLGPVHAPSSNTRCMCLLAQSVNTSCRRVMLGCRSSRSSFTSLQAQQRPHKPPMDKWVVIRELCRRVHLGRRHRSSMEHHVSNLIREKPPHTHTHTPPTGVPYPKLVAAIRSLRKDRVRIADLPHGGRRGDDLGASIRGLLPLDFLHGKRPPRHVPKPDALEYLSVPAHAQ